MFRIILTICCAVILVAAFDKIFPKEELGTFALDKETKLKFANASNTTRHCEGISADEICVTTEQVVFEKPDVLLLGNSQLHAVNQAELGESVVGDFITVLETEGRTYQIISLPNGNLCEFTSQAEKIIKASKSIEVFISVVYDDTRTSSLRAEIKHAEKEEEIFTPFRDKTESIIRTYLQASLKFNDVMEHLRSQILITLYKTRNFLLRINASTERPKNIFAYAENLNCLSRFILTYPNNQIHLYIAPIRSDYEIPYKISDYESFKDEISHLEVIYENVKFHNLEQLVPNKYWGRKDSTQLINKTEIDFMHFQSNGHEILARKIIELTKAK